MTSMNLLAETLAKNGLASSQTEAIRMAQNIISTEKKVMHDFDSKANKMDDDLSAKREVPKTYQEEIDELIEKTDPSKKDYHVMVSGYKKDQTMKEVDQLLAEVKAEPKVEEVAPVSEPIVQAPVIEPVSTPVQVKEPVPVVEEVSIPVLQEVVEEPVVQEVPVPVIQEVVEESVAQAPVSIPDLKIEESVPKAEPIVQESAFTELNKPVEQVSAVDAALAATTESVVETLKEDLVIPDTIGPIHPQPIAPPTFNEPVHVNPGISTNQAINNAVANAKPVYTDAVNGNKMLKELMDEQADEVYSNRAVDQTPSIDNEAADLLEKPVLDDEEETPEYQVYNFIPEEPKDEPVQETLSNAPLPQSEADDFILPVNEVQAPVADEPVATPQETEPEKKEFKNPIDKVDLMDHFKFG
jgi:hypothetical protein